MIEEIKTCLTNGDPVMATADHLVLKPNGQQNDYVVICPEERAKGFVRPFRDIYVHVGKTPKYPTRKLTDEEEERYAGWGYVLFEEYPESKSPVTGKFWTQPELNGGCGTVTRIGTAIAETYARDPNFYGSIFCVGCGKHLPVSEFKWDGTDEIVGS